MRDKSLSNIKCVTTCCCFSLLASRVNRLALVTPSLRGRIFVGVLRLHQSDGAVTAVPLQ